MTVDEIKTADLESIEARAEEIRALTEADDPAADFAELNAEYTAISERREVLKAEAEARAAQEKADLATIIGGAGQEVEKLNSQLEEKTMNETRNTPEYIEAFARYLKTGDATECRALLTVNSVEEGAQLEVPVIVEDKIRTAWEKSDLFSRVGKTFIKGNLKIGYEISGTDAVVHLEGDAAPDEETLTLGAVSIIPQSIKKWITFSDEAMDLKGQAFIDYIYDELTYRIIKKLENLVVAAIIAAVGSSTSTKAGQATVEAALSGVTVATALGVTSDEATDLVVIGNKATWAAFKSLTTADGYKIADPFEGLPFVFNNSLKAYDTADENDPYLIVGDLTNGIRVNMPNGTGVSIKLDDTSLAEADLVKVTGRLFAGIGVIMPNAFCVVTKPAAEDEGGEG